jgi:hypothetical protein
MSIATNDMLINNPARARREENPKEERRLINEKLACISEGGKSGKIHTWCDMSPIG